MPYKVVRNYGGCRGYAVARENQDKSPGKLHGCHPTRTAANRQLAALYAAENEESEKSDIITTLKKIFFNK